MGQLGGGGGAEQHADRRILADLLQGCDLLAPLDQMDHVEIALGALSAMKRICAVREMFWHDRLLTLFGWVPEEYVYGAVVVVQPGGDCGSA